MNSSLSLWQRLARAGSTLPMAQTLTYYASFIALGLTSASLGPTLLGLSEQTGSDLGQISYLFTARSSGYLFGSFIGGRLFDRLPAHRTMAVALIVIALLLAAVPEIPLLVLLVVAFLAVGFMEAVVDVGSNTLIVWVHRERVGPFMNALHMFFALGGFLALIIIAQVILITGSFKWSYWLLAILLVPVILRFLPLPNPQPIVSHQERASARPNVVLLVLLAAFFLTVAAAESSFAGWIFTYAVKTHLADEPTAAYANAAYWGAFTVFRLVSIPLATRLRPRTIIIADMLLAFTGIASMFLFSSSSLALWVGTILFGFGIASAFPTLLTFAGRHMKITGAVTGWFFVGASLGNMTIPWIIGQLFDRVGAVSVLWVIGGVVTAGLVVFFLVLLYLRATNTLRAQEAK